jgi:hypothetical protein
VAWFLKILFISLILLGKPAILESSIKNEGKELASFIFNLKGEKNSFYLYSSAFFKENIKKIQLHDSSLNYTRDISK